MDNLFESLGIEAPEPQPKPTPVTLPEKLQKLISNYSELKVKYETLKEDYESTLTNNIELDEERAQFLNEKSHLELKIAQLTEELQNKTAEVEMWKKKYNDIDVNTRAAVSKIDSLLASIDFD